MEHQPRMPKTEPDAAEGALPSTRHVPQQQGPPSRHTEPRIKEERPALEYEASPNCDGLGFAENGPLTPAESTNSTKWQRRNIRRSGRDHRRYYQERWKMEYLMDYDCLRHGLVCMVCGSTLATLKLSTIKRHILQKHQDTMLLTRTEKEVVIATWIEHLLNHSYPQENTDTLALEPTAVHTHLAPVLSPAGGPAGREAVVRPEAGPGRPGKGCRRPVRRYYQQRWRTEYLMEYDGARHGLVCLVCGSALATLKLSTIKRHILQKHPASLRDPGSQRLSGGQLRAGCPEQLLHQSAGGGLLCQSQPGNRGKSAGWNRLRQSQPADCSQSADGGLLRQSQPEDLGQSQDAGLLNQSTGTCLSQSAIESRLLRQSATTETTGLPGFRLRQSATASQGAGPSPRQSPAAIPRGTPTPAEQSRAEVKPLGAGLTPLVEQWRVEEEEAGPGHLLRQSEIEVELSGEEPGGVADLSDSLRAGSIVKVLGFPELVAHIPAENNHVLEQRMTQHSPLARLTSKGVRRYYQQRWRVDHLMDYDWWRHGLVCMVCGKSLATLTLSTIKRHILQNHPHSLNFNQAERENILEAWNERSLQHDYTAVQLVMPELGASWSAGKRPRCHYQERWRFEYLMDYDRWWHTLVCMVCGKSLATVALSTIKRHILQNHPHSLNFHQAEKENILEAWSKTTSREESAVIKSGSTGKEDISGSRVQPVAADIPGATSEAGVNIGDNSETAFAKCEDTEWDGECLGERSPAEIEVCVEEQELSSPARTVRGRVPGRDHWRNYQERWRLEYLMDYDQGRHGLVCMVCGSTLATLKLSTIKRHILQKHQDTMGFTLAEKVMVVEEWNKKIAAIAKMDFWQVPGSGNGCSAQHAGVILTGHQSHRAHAHIPSC